MRQDIGIFINSSHRAGPIKTVVQFPLSWKAFTKIVVPKDQAMAYTKKQKWPILKIPADVPSYLPPQRQWVMENSIYKFVFFMDDDLSFGTRQKDMKLKKSTPAEMEAMLTLVKSFLIEEEIPIVGISTQNGNNRVEDDFTDITRVTRCYCVNKAIFNIVGKTFAPIPDFVMEDFHINLCFLEQGYSNRVIYKYAQVDSGTNTKGGCSDYRTAKSQKTSANLLAKLHPNYVSVVKKRTKSNWKGFEQDKNGYVTRTDVIVHWKKAFHQKQRPPKGIINFL